MYSSAELSEVLELSGMLVEGERALCFLNSCHFSVIPNSGKFQPIRVIKASNKTAISNAIASAIRRSAKCRTGGLTHALERSVRFLPEVC